MKRTYFVVILMFVLAACGSSSTTGTGGGPSSSPSSGPASSPTAGPTSEPAAGPSSSPSVSAYSTVSGQVVERGTGRPYPNAWVRFVARERRLRAGDPHRDGRQREVCNPAPAGPVPGDGGRLLRAQRGVRHRREGPGRQHDHRTRDQRGGLRRVPDNLRVRPGPLLAVLSPRGMERASP